MLWDRFASYCGSNHDAWAARRPRETAIVILEPREQLSWIPLWRSQTSDVAGYEGPADRLAHYERLVGATPGVERKGATMPYTARNGHMFSFLDAVGTMALRLPPDAREAFMAQYRTSLAKQHGHTMTEYVVVPDALLERTDELATWLVRSHDWIGTLKPKPTTRPRKR
jgi:hypothetical protein